MQSRYQTEFYETRTLGKGAFSTVFEVRSLISDRIFAIKKIPFEENDETKTLKEKEVLSKLNSDYVVKYIDSWIESNYYLGKADSKIDAQSLLLNPNKSLLLHMQTELCLMTLREVIIILEDTCKDSIDTIIFSIANGLAVQILECVDYLHSLTPQIIHRDLKPENIMISMGPRNCCVKLADFGLSTYHKFIEESHTKYIGTEKYRAPELNRKSYDTKADVYSLGIIMTELFCFDFNDEIECRVDDLVQTNYFEAKKVFIKCLDFIPKNRPSCTILLDKKSLWSYNALECDLFKSIETINEINEFFTTLSQMCENKMIEEIKLIDSEEQFEQLYKNYKQTVEQEINNSKFFIKNKLLINPFLQQFNKKIIASEKYLKDLLKDQIARQKSETEIIMNEIKTKYKQAMSKSIHTDRHTANQELRQQQHNNTVDSIIKQFENKTISQTKEKINDLIKSTLEMCFMEDKKNSDVVLLAINHYENAIEKQFEKIQSVAKDELIKRRIGIEKEASNIFLRECVYGSEADRERFKHEFAHKLYEMNAKFKQKIDENERIVLEHTLNLIKTCVTHYDTLMTQYLEDTLDEKWLKKLHEITLKTSVNMFTYVCINKENRFIETYRNDLKAKLELSFNEYLAKVRENIDKIEKQYTKEVLQAVNRYTKDMEKIMFDNQFIEDEEFSRISKQVSDLVIKEIERKEWQKTVGFSDYITELSKMLSEEYIRLFGINAKTREIAHNTANKYCKVLSQKYEEVMYAEIKLISEHEFDELHEIHKQSAINELKIRNPFKCESFINSYLSQLEKNIEKLEVELKKMLSEHIARTNAENEILVHDVSVFYKEEMNKYYHNTCYLSQENLKKIHLKTFEHSLSEFASRRQPNCSIKQFRAIIESTVGNVFTAIIEENNKNTSAVNE